MKNVNSYIKITILICSILFSSCIKDLEKEGVFGSTNCHGVVLNQCTQQPIPNMRVVITDGNKMFSVEHTHKDGSFEIEVQLEEIGKGYYLHLEADSLYESMDIGLSDIAWGAKEYNLGTIYIVGPEVPKVSTISAETVSASSIHCVGTVDDEGKSTVTERGFVYSTIQYPTINESKATFGSGIGEYGGVIAGLSVNTTYYVRAYARNGVGVSYGDQISLRTLDGLPTVQTNEVSNISPISATCGGDVLTDGGFSVIAKGVCWSITTQPTISNAHTTNGSGLGSFVSQLNNLEPGKTYYLRAYAQNSAGVGYGEIVSFTTFDGLPTVTTSDVSNITSSSAVGGGIVVTDGGFPISDRGVCFSTTHNPTTSDPHTTDGFGIGSFVSQLTNLSPHTTYYVRAFATNGAGTIYGEEKSFVTQ